MYTLNFVKRNISPEIRVINNEEKIVIIVHPKNDNNPFYNIETHAHMGGGEIYKKILECLRLTNANLTDKAIDYIEKRSNEVSKELISFRKNI